MHASPRNSMRLFLTRSGLALCLALLAGTDPACAQEPHSRLAVEVEWGDRSLPELPPGTEPPRVSLGVSAGTITDLDPRPFDPAARPDPSRPSAGPFEVSQEAAGIARAWVEAPITSELIIQLGAQTARVPLATLVESGGWVRTPVNARLRRIPWDAISVRWLEGEGIYAPGAKVPISITVQPLVDARPTQIQASVRPHGGGEPLWTSPRVAQPMDQAKPLAWAIPAPAAEGTYVMEITVLADTAAAETSDSSLSRFTRIWKRRKPASTLTMRRRVSFVVLDARSPRRVAQSSTNTSSETQRDLIEFARIKPQRWHASGRNAVADPEAWSIPPQALSEPGDAGPKDRIMGLIARPVDASILPVASPAGWPWTALRLQNARPGQPHKLVLTVTGGPGERMGIALLSSSAAPRILLDTAAAIDPASPTPQTYSWIVWPDTTETTLLVVNQSSQGPIRLGAVELREIPSPPAALPDPGAGPAGRHLALTIDDAHDLNRFGGSAEPDAGPIDRFSQILNLATYLKQCGASTAVLGSPLADRAARQGLGGHAQEDCLAPDLLQLALQILAREGLEALIAVPCEDALPGLPPPGSAHAQARGLVRYGPDGQSLHSGYPLFHPEVRAALQQRLEQVASVRKQHPNCLGVLMHLGHESCLPGGNGVIPDHHTYQQFLQASFSSAEIARLSGQTGTEAERLKQRARFLAGEGSKPWLDWRCAEVGRLYHDLADAVARAAPGARLVLTTPTFDLEPATSEALRADRGGLSPVDAWRSLGFDPEVWPRDDQGPVLVRSVSQNGTQRLRDLASSPELDTVVLNQTERGLWIGGTSHPDPGYAQALIMRAASSPHPATAEESLAHAVAALDANWVFISSQALSGLEDQMARFARVFRALPPATPAEGAAIRPDSGVAVRTIPGNGQTFISYANDTPYRVLVESCVQVDPSARIDDLGRSRRLLPADAPSGGKSLVIELAPYAVATVSIAQPNVQIQHRPPFIPSLAELDAQAEDISARLASLSATSSELSALPNGGFELRPARPAGPGGNANEIKPQPQPSATLGWSLAEPGQGALTIDHTAPHSGQASLRLTPRTRPAALQSDAFLPPPASQLVLSSWMKAEKPRTRVRITLEGESRGKPMNRQAEALLSTEWKPLKIQTSDFPAEGLDRARVRFEILEGDSVWIDDVDLLSVDRAAPPARRAHRVLTAALQAYREKRYADFARLTASPWARAVLEPGRALFEPALRTGSASGTDLPPTRRIR